MKEPIEELFKQSLKGHEMPYNPDAWKAMNARLDAVNPVVSSPSYLKYYLGAAGIGVAAIATYFFLSGGNTPHTSTAPTAKEITTKRTSTTTNKPSTGTREVQTDNTSVISNPTNIPTSSDERLQSTGTTQSSTSIDAHGKTKTNIESSGKTLHEGPTVNVITSNNSNYKETTTAPERSEFNQKMDIPVVADICLNAKTTITNPNGKELYILDELNQIIETIPANKSVIFKPSVVGNYSIGYQIGNDIQAASHFQVNRIPDAEFMLDLVNKYDNGLPATHVEAIAGQGTYYWKADKQSAQGNSADLHFYKKGEQTIELTVDNGQCSSTVEKTIYVEKDYNLMAVTGFTPTSNDPKKNTFMPYALTQRDVNFVLTIIDGRDGGVVYKTSDASLPWDGTDMRSGRRSETPQVYVWKVVILNPAANEPGEYVGTITMN